MKIENEILKKYIQYKCNKYNCDDFEKDEIKKIKDISLNNMNFLHQILNIDLSEIDKFTELEILSLQNFKIDDLMIAIFKRCKKLKSLQLEVCDFDSSTILNLEQIENLIIKYCKIKEWKNIFLPKNVTIASKEMINFKDLNNIENIVNLKINNASIYNFKEILKFKSLEYLNIDGSKIDNEEAIDIISSKVKISRKKDALDII